MLIFTINLKCYLAFIFCKKRKYITWNKERVMENAISYNGNINQLYFFKLIILKLSWNSKFY